MSIAKRLFAGLIAAALPAIPAAQAEPAPPQLAPPQLTPPPPQPDHAYTPSTPPVLVAQAPGVNPYLRYTPPPAYGFNPFVLLTPQPQPAPAQAYTMRPSIAPGTKKQMMQLALPVMTNVMHMSMPDAMNWFVAKYKAKPGLSFDDVLESMNLRANQLNFKHVGENLMWKDFQAVLEDKDAPRIEVHSYCDIKVGRDLLKISPEFVVFLPCRVAVMEDANKDIWVLMLDWNLDWISGYEQQMGVTPELSKGALDIRDKMDQIMRAGANGEL